eukprot:TRINITY_DN7712_c0_g1_i2.p1 TRINITY_DN7712_c0_g1~~TRINITY_DN7712_c0_g1_i2.p1  ORF type:complete len:192 (-),score=32.50 TRINITY_DN7712_c0_g1_i2:29-604(-)
MQRLHSAKSKSSEVHPSEVREILSDKREIGKHAVWSLSSAKPGFGVEQLRDDNLETYWQSDGAQPHTININFARKFPVDEIAIYADFSLDESYTPQAISIRSGTTFHDLKELKKVEMQEPTGWVVFSLSDAQTGKPLQTNFIQIAVLSNHQNGRDTHIRQLKIYGPRQSISSMMHIPNFTSPASYMYNTLR